MKYTKQQRAISTLVSKYPAVLHSVCDQCEHTIWLEWMYRVQNNSPHSTNKTHYYFCTSCASDKKKAYSLVYPTRITAHDVILNNAIKEAERANKRAEDAVDALHYTVSKVHAAEKALKQIIDTANDPEAPWHPTRDEFVMRTLVAAENGLREISEQKEP